MLAPVEDVHHRDGQGVGVDATDVSEQRKLAMVCRRLGNGEGHTENRVCAKLGLVVGAV